MLPYRIEEPHWLSAPPRPAGRRHTRGDHPLRDPAKRHRIVAFHFISAVGEQVLGPRPALANGENHLGSGGVGDIGGGQIDHEQPAIGVNDDMALAQSVRASP